MKHKQDEPFYSRGLQFECTRCGKCCTAYPGFVYLSEHDIDSIAKFLKLNKGSFISRYTRRVEIFHEPRLSLIEKPPFDCIFWDSLCTIYPVRPYQCRSYPFWKRNLVSEREWEKVGNICPGINRGRVHSRVEIDWWIRNTPPYNCEQFSSWQATAGTDSK